MPAHGAMFGNTIYITISQDTADVDLWNEAGQPTGVVNVVCYITNGAIVSGNPGMVIKNFAAGSTIKLIFSGGSYIVGRGGTGGKGGNAGGAAGSAGGKGGTALSITVPVSISVIDGFIFGGGAGGKGGKGSSGLGAGGGGGGGGQGRPNASGGAGGQAQFASGDGDGGKPGNFGGGGQGGASGGSDASVGGFGKNWGGYTVGEQAQSNAVDCNGQPTSIITWIDGYDSTHVKGKVS
jgi:hypothetical protein